MNLPMRSLLPRPLKNEGGEGENSRLLRVSSSALLTIVFTLMLMLAARAYAAKDSCFECHTTVEGTSVVYKDDVHYTKAISCADCHGGDAREDDQNVSMNADRGFKLRATRQGMADYCGRCHSDAKYMRRYQSRARVDQAALYRTSVHGKRMAAGHTGSANCVDCHSVHDIRAVNDPLSTVNPAHLAETCSKCHAETADLFSKSRHGQVFNSHRRPSCTVCHASHATEPATADLVTSLRSGCARCHKAGSAGAKAATEIAGVLTRLEAAGPGSKDALARVRLAIHSLDLAAIKRAAEPGVASLDAGQK